MVDKSAVGATDEPFTMPVERGKIREFARATMSSAPEYSDDPVAPIPPTFLTTVSFWSPPGQSVFSKVKMDLRSACRRASTRSTRRRASGAA
jgi:hypothetical protein